MRHGYKTLRDRQLRMMEEGARTAERLRKSTREHTSILGAVRAGDAEAARDAVRVHTDAVSAMLGARR